MQGPLLGRHGNSIGNDPRNAGEEDKPEKTPNNFPSYYLVPPAALSNHNSRLPNLSTRANILLYSHLVRISRFLKFIYKNLELYHKSNTALWICQQEEARTYMLQFYQPRLLTQFEHLQE